MMTLEMKLDECFKKGFEEGRSEILLHMLKTNHPISDISKITGISEAEILELKNKTQLNH